MVGKISRFILLLFVFSQALFCLEIPSLEEFCKLEYKEKISTYIEMDLYMMHTFTGGGSYDYRDYRTQIYNEGENIVPEIISIITNNSLFGYEGTFQTTTEIDICFTFVYELEQMELLSESEKMQFANLLRLKLVEYFNYKREFIYLRYYLDIIEELNGNFENILAMTETESIEYFYNKYNRQTENELIFVDEGFSYDGYKDLVEKYLPDANSR